MAILADMFFESFDLLPVEYRRMLDFQTRCPTMEDLQAAWTLVQETRTFDDLFREHARRYDPDEYKAIKAREKEEHDRKKQAAKRAAEQARLKARMDREGRYVQVTYRNPNYDDGKHDRLIARVKAEKAHDMITKKQGTLVNTTSKYLRAYVWQPYVSAADREKARREQEAAKLGFDPYSAPDKNHFRAGTNKRLHNGF